MQKISSFISTSNSSDGLTYTQQLELTYKSDQQ